MALVKNDLPKSEVKISKSQKLTKQKKLGFKKTWWHQDTTLVVPTPIVLWDPCSRQAQAHNSTGSPEHGARVEEPRHFRTAAWKPNVVFCFSETSNWNTIFFHITRHFFTTCWTCLIWMYLLAMGSLHFSNKGFTLKSSVSSFHRRDLGLAQVGQFTQSISAHSLVPQTFGRKSTFSATKIYLSLSDKITTESSSLKTWESEHSPKQVTSVLKWCFEICWLLRDENHHTSVHWATLFFQFCLEQSLYSLLLWLGGFTSKCREVTKTTMYRLITYGYMLVLGDVMAILSSFPKRHQDTVVSCYTRARDRWDLVPKNPTSVPCGWPRSFSWCETWA